MTPETVTTLTTRGVAVVCMAVATLCTLLPFESTALKNVQQTLFTFGLDLWANGEKGLTRGRHTGTQLYRTDGIAALG